MNRDSGVGGTLGSEAPQEDVVRGWEIRNFDYNSVATDGLVPFVQLIGLYSKEEIDKLVQKDGFDVGDRQVTFTDGAWDGSKRYGGYEDEDNAADFDKNEYFAKQIKSKFIKINIKNYNQKEDNVFTNGIILAANASQVGNEAFETYDNNLPKDSGGIGITDLQIETGTKDFMNRRYKLRMTVTDPFILNDSKEYLKLSTLQSQFLLIHGWSNPHQIDGMEQFDLPPQVTDIDTTGFPNGRMTVDLTQPNTGGMWSAATVAITMFDFAFNETGQLEASFTFMPREISFASTYRIDLVSATTKLFLGTGEETRNADEQEADESASTQFAGLVAGLGSVAGEFGKNLADVIAEEQQAYANNNESIAGLFSNMDLNFDAADTLRNFSENVTKWSDSSDNADLGVIMANQKDAESRNRFPYAGPGIRVYSKTATTTNTTQTSDEDADISVTEQRIQRNSKIQYYYLGWLMEAIRFSMWDMNKNKVRNGQTPFDLKFKYYNIPQDSHFNLAFQDELYGGTRQAVKDLIPDMIVKFKENHLPRLRVWDPVGMEMFGREMGDNRIEQPQASGYNLSTQKANIILTPITADEIRTGGAADFQEHQVYTKPDGSTVTTKPYQVIGKTSAEVFEGWESLTRKEKFIRLSELNEAVAYGGPTEDNLDRPYVADYRRTLVEVDVGDLAYKPGTANPVRIMHPDFDGQLLYNWVWKGSIKLNIDVTDKRERVDCGLYMASTTRATLAGPAGAGNAVGHWLYSKLNNFFVGEIGLGANPVLFSDDERKWEMAAGATYGIIMPAVSARYYSPGVYIDLQQRWFNKHKQFLADHFSNVIRTNVDNAGPAIYNMDDKNGLPYQPIDLEWLTGRKYDHNIPPFIKKNESSSKSYYITSGVAGLKPNWSQDTTVGNYNINFQTRTRLHSVESLVDQSRRIILGGNTDNLLAQKEADLTGVQRRANAINLRLNGDGANQVGQTYTHTLNSLENMENNKDKYSADQLFQAAIEVADILKVTQGYEGVMSFWENQINKIIVEFYNKDLINVSEVEITANEDNLYTVAGSNTEPSNRSDKLFGFEEALTRWRTKNPQQYNEDLSAYTTRSQNAVLSNYPNETWTTNELMQHDESYDSSNRRVKIVDSASKGFGNIADETPDGYAFKFFKGLEHQSGSPNYDVSFEDWKKENVNLARNQVAPTFGRYLSFRYENPYRYNIFKSDDISKLGELDLDSDSGIEYLYMNIISDEDRNRWTTGHAMRSAADNGDYSATMIIKNATIEYNSFVTKYRTIAEKYLEQFIIAQNEAEPLRRNLSFDNEKIAQIEESLHSTQNIINSLENNEALSPFISHNEALDVSYDWDRGGGRNMEVHGVVAQQWAARFDGRTVFGATDVAHYNAAGTGTPIPIINATKWGWLKLRSSIVNDVYNHDKDQTIADAALLRQVLKPARFVDWSGPKSILNIYGLANDLTYMIGDKTYDVRGLKGAEADGDQPSALMSEASGGDPSKMSFAFVEEEPSMSEYIFFHGGSSSKSSPMKVKHLMRSGFVNIDLIKEIIADIPDLKDINFSFDYDPEYSDSSYEITDDWPMLNTSKSSHADDIGQHTTGLGYEKYGADYYIATNYTGPAHLVDKDLDFVIQINDLYPKPDNYQVGDTIVIARDKMAASINTYKYDDGGNLHILQQGYTPENIGREDEQAVAIHTTPQGTAEYYVATSFKEGDFIKLTNELTTLYDRLMENGSGEFITTDFNAVYSKSGSSRLDKGDHIPELPVNIAKKMINGDDNMARSDAPAGGKVSNARYTSYGRAAQSDEYPYGIPPDAPEDPQFRGIRAPNSAAQGRSMWYNDQRTGICVNDILNTMPDDFERGFFSSVSFADGFFNGGADLNKGLVKYIAEDFIHLFTHGRRIAKHSSGNLKRTNCMWDDVCYRDLMPEVAGADNVNISRADFSNQTIMNVAEIPIKREVVDNLLSKRNSNMSLLQFFQQILTPSAIGLAGNVQLGVRNVNGVIDIIPASISYKQQTTDFFKEQLDKQIEEENGNNSSVKLNHLLFTYKTRNSLIENIDMSSKMDPAAFLTYQNSSDLLLGRDYNVLKLLSYEGVAEDFKEFLDGTQRADDSGDTYSGIITIGTDNRVQVNKTRFKELPSSVVDSMIAQNPERWAKITSMMQGNNNFTTELLAFYMRSVTLTIHGTTNLQPFNLINVTGVMPDLEGIYIITNLTERITPTSFQTIIEGKLLKRKRVSDGAYI